MVRNSYLVIVFSILIVATVGFVFQSSASGSAVYLGPHGEYRYEDISRPYPYPVTDVPQGYAQQVIYPYPQANNPYLVGRAYQPQGYASDTLTTVSSYSLYPQGYKPDVPYYIFGVQEQRGSVYNPAYSVYRSYVGRGLTTADYRNPVYASPTPYSNY